MRRPNTYSRYVDESSETEALRNALQWALQYADFSVCDDSPLHRSALTHALKLAGMNRVGGLYD